MCHHLIVGLTDGLDMFFGTRAAWWDETLAAQPQGFCQAAAAAAVRIWDETHRYRGDVEQLRLRVLQEAADERPLITEPGVLAELDRIVEAHSRLRRAAPAVRSGHGRRQSPEAKAAPACR